MIPVVMTRSLQQAMLSEMTEAGKPLAAPTLILFKNAVSPDERTTIAQLQEADFAGYAAVENYTFSDVYLDAEGRTVMVGDDTTFIATGPTPSNTIYGVALVNAAKTVLHGAARLTNPVQLDEAGRGLNVQPVFVFPRQDV